MDRISEEKFIERYDALPEALRQIILSDESINTLQIISRAHHLGEERIKKVAGVVGYIFLGLIHIEDFAKEIAAETNIDRRLANEIAREVKLKILSPVIPEIQKLYHYGATGTTAAREATPAQPEILRPAFAPPPSDIRSDAPFILRKESEEAERVRPRDETLMRPSFYEGASGGMNQEARSMNEGSVARLEIGPSVGSGQEKRKEPQVGRTEEPEIRVVHYSGPQTPVDPFAPQQMANGAEQMAEPQQPPKDIHPENVVDLKDLPK